MEGDIIEIDIPSHSIHVSAKESLEEIKQAFGRGQRIYGETCTHYLVLDREDLAKPDFQGAKYVCSPALRTQEHRDALWQAIDNKWLNAVSSDHCGFDWETQKHMGFGEGKSFADIPNGAPSMKIFILLVLFLSIYFLMISLEIADQAADAQDEGHSFQH